MSLLHRAPLNIQTVSSSQHFSFVMFIYDFRFLLLLVLYVFFSHFSFYISCLHKSLWCNSSVKQQELKHKLQWHIRYNDNVPCWIDTTGSHCKATWEEQCSDDPSGIRVGVQSVGLKGRGWHHPPWEGLASCLAALGQY